MAWRRDRDEYDDALRGRGLRFVLLEEIRRRGTMTVAEMVVVVGEHGYPVRGRTSKTISDALRWEVARGRVQRIARGVYRYGRVPATTARRVRLFSERCHAWVVAITRHETPPPTPPTPPERCYFPWFPPEDPARPPWDNLRWLWTT